MLVRLSFNFYSSIAEQWLTDGMKNRDTMGTRIEPHGSTSTGQFYSVQQGKSTISQQVIPDIPDLLTVR